VSLDRVEFDDYAADYDAAADSSLKRLLGDDAAFMEWKVAWLVKRLEEKAPGRDRAHSDCSISGVEPASRFLYGRSAGRSIRFPDWTYPKRCWNKPFSGGRNPHRCRTFAYCDQASRHSRPVPSTWF